MSIFGVKNTYTNDKELKEDLEKINKMNETDVTKMTAEELLKLDSLYERSALSIRRILEEKNSSEDLDVFFKTNYSNGKTHRSENVCLENLPVSIEEKNGIYHLFTPYTFRRGMSESFFLADCLRAEVNKKINEGMAFDVKGKQLVIALRIGKKHSHSRYKDNDNLETSELINVLFGEAFGKSDCVSNMSFMSDFMTNDNEKIHGFHMFILPYNSEEIKPKKILELFYPQDVFL